MFRLAISRAPIAARALRPAGTRQLKLATVRPLLAPTSVRWKSAAPSVSNLVDWNGPKITYEQLKPRTEQPSPDAYLIDVREPDEVILGSIPSSVNLPLSTFAEGFHLNPVAFKEKYGFEKPKKDQEIVFYCRSGKRSATASDIAARYGYTNIHNYEGSWLEWTSKEQGKQS